MKFSVIGGDTRQAVLAKRMAEDGHDVTAFGLDINGGGLPIKKAGSTDEALHGTEYIVLPLPATDSAGNISTPMYGGKIRTEDVISAVGPEQTLFAGKADGALKEAADKRGVRMIDYFSREELAVKNAGLTAEGAVRILLEERHSSLRGADVLVVGFGRIGKLLSMKLKAMGASVTVSARKHSDIAWIEELGYSSADTRNLAEIAGNFDAIINTVPALVLDDRVLERVRNDCLVIDLASKPGGTDFDAAKRRGINVIWALSLPGRSFPEAAGAAICDTIYNIIRELECAD